MLERAHDETPLHGERSARPNPAVERPDAPALTCSANTLRFADLRTRVQAAAAAGFTGLGLRVSDVIDAGLDLREIRDLLAAHALRTLELEHTWDWAGGDVDAVEKLVFDYAATVGVRQLNVPMFYPHPLPVIVDAFAALCDRAAQYGVLVGFEFLPYSHVTNVHDAWRIVSDASRPNGGLVVDFWHLFRSGADTTDLYAIPAEKVTSLQLCDVGPTPHTDLADEARHHRQLPGCGAGATSATLAALVARGVRAPVSVEVFSDELDALPAGTAAWMAYTTAAQALARAAITPTPWITNLEAAP